MNKEQKALRELRKLGVRPVDGLWCSKCGHLHKAHSYCPDDKDPHKSYGTVICPKYGEVRGEYE